jgi:hypothetical protein
VRRSGATGRGRAAGPAGKRTEEGREEGDGSDRWTARSEREREREEALSGWEAGEVGPGMAHAGKGGGKGELGRAWLGRVERRGERGDGPREKKGRPKRKKGGRPGWAG